jgi:hypothetical protein
VSEPVVFISHFEIRRGSLEALKQLSTEIGSAILAEKPRTVAYLMYLDDAGTEMTVVHCFPDADSMDLHFEGADERSAAAYEYLEPRGWEIYGAPNHQALEMLRQGAEAAGVTLTVQPEPLGGFLRLTTG